MLNQVLHEIENCKGPITMGELSRKLGIEINALEGMIQFWVRKGRLQITEDQANGANCSCGSSSSSCSPIGDCVFVAKMPNTYSLAIQKNK